MTDAQMAALIAVLKEIAVERPYTITGAADWGMLLVVGGLLVAAVGAMWLDLKNTITNQKIDSTKENERLRTELNERIDTLWKAHEDCQRDCCPRGKTRPEN